jgi:PIN domain nuclease of toxin-antitoxin system
MTHYVLDACALVAVLKGENGAEAVDNFFQQGTYHRLSLADAVGVATAIERGGVFVTADHHELETLANKEILKFFWFR